jgi:HK97 family phage major capsid protein
MAKIHDLRQRKAELVEQCRELNDKDDLAAADQASLDTKMAEIGAVNAKIKREESLMEEERSLVGVDIDEPASRIAPTPNKAADEKRFMSLGEQLQAIAFADTKHTKREEWDPRLYDLFVPGRGFQAASDASGANESVPSDGGFAVQTDFAAGILEMSHDMGDVMSRVRRIPISANSNALKVLGVDETSRADGSRWGGVQGYWANEAATVTATRPKYREIELSLKKLMALGYATEELLQDASALESVMMQAFAEEISFKTEDAIVNGDGSGKPLGFLNSGALVTVAAESGQAAGTIRVENIVNMMARLPVRSIRNSVWYINQDCLPQLWQMTIGSGTAVSLLYQPPGLNAISANAPYGTLMGRPVVPIEYCATLGTVGDIMLVDPTQYLMIDKNGVQSAASMHVRFLYDEMTFRVTYRLDGQPGWRVALTPKNGTNTQSPYVALATR